MPVCHPWPVSWRFEGTRCLMLLLMSISLLVIVGGAAAEIKRIVLLESMSVPAVQSHSRWFAKSMQKIAADEGWSLELEEYNAEGDWGRAEDLLRKALADGRPDVVVSNATLASKTADRVLAGLGIPLVFMTVSDPVGAGLIEQIGHPGGRYITGKVHAINRETRIGIMMQLIGDAIAHRPVRIGFIHSTYPSAMGDIRELKAAVQGRDDVNIIPRQVPYGHMSEGVGAMLEMVRDGIVELEAKVDFWWEPSGPLGESNEYTRLLLDRSARPIIMGLKSASVRLGAIMHLSPNEQATGEDVALLVRAVMDGADPGSLPATPPDRFDLGINLTAALAAGFVVPPDLLELAGRNVYRQDTP